MVITRLEDTTRGAGILEAGHPTARADDTAAERKVNEKRTHVSNPHVLVPRHWLAARGVSLTVLVGHAVPRDVGVSLVNAPLLLAAQRERDAAKPLLARRHHTHNTPGQMRKRRTTLYYYSAKVCVNYRLLFL